MSSDDQDSHRIWLRDESTTWVRDGLVDEPTLARIRRRYALDTIPESANRSVVVFGVLGAGLMIAGIGLLFAHNWDELGRPVRAGLAFALLLLAQGLAAFALRRTPRVDALSEGSAVVLVGALGVSMALVSQTYHVGGDFADLVLAWLVLSLPVPYLLDSRLAAAFVWAALLYLPGGREDSWDQGFSFLALGIAILPTTVRARHGSPDDLRTRLLSFVTAGAGTLGITMLADEHTDALGVPVFVTAAALARLTSRDEGHDGLALAATIGLGGALLFAADADFAIRVHHNPWSTDDLLWLVLAAIALALLVGRTRAFSASGRRDAIGTVVVVSGVWMTAGLAWAGAELVATTIANVALLAYGLDHVLRGLATLRRGPTNVGLVMLSGLFLARFFDRDFSFVVRGLGMMAVGGAFLATNLILVRRSTRRPA